MITFDDFISAGYKEFLPTKLKDEDKFCQKKIKENKKIKYFINIYGYNKDKYFKTDACIAAVTFYSHKNWFEVKLNEVRAYGKIAEIEEFFENIYKHMNCVPDKHNND